MPRFILDGHEWSVSQKQVLMLQRLKEAMIGIAEGSVSHTGLLEVNGEGLHRMFYMVSGDEGYDKLIISWAAFQKFIASEAVLKQGSAPPENRSLAPN